MSQYIEGTIQVNNGNPTLTGTGTEWLTNALPGQIIRLGDDAVFYEIGSVDSDTQITLTGNYLGTSTPSVNYVIHQGFTPNINLPELSPGDRGTAELWTRAMRAIDAEIKALQDRVTANGG